MEKVENWTSNFNICPGLLWILWKPCKSEILFFVHQVPIGNNVGFCHETYLRGNNPSRNSEKKDISTSPRLSACQHHPLKWRPLVEESMGWRCQMWSNTLGQSEAVWFGQRCARKIRAPALWGPSPAWQVIFHPLPLHHALMSPSTLLAQRIKTTQHQDADQQHCTHLVEVEMCSFRQLNIEKFLLVF